MPRRGARVTLTCLHEPCQTLFEVLPYRKDTAKYCSPECRALAPVAPRQTLADRFWAKVAVCEHGKACRDCCWPWQASKGSSGYGTIYVLEQRRLVGAHVVAFFLHTGRWPADGMEIMHHCPAGHRKDCGNFWHLHEGTHLENMREMFANGGPTQTWRKVTEAQEEELCLLYATGAWTYKQLAEKYGLADRTPYEILKRRGHAPSLPGSQARRVHAARGERSHNCKITDAQWQEALTLYTTGKWSMRRLADRYGVNRSTIKRRLKHQL